jgi:Ca2+-binding EF-hand superfamily protein
LAVSLALYLKEKKMKAAELLRSWDTDGNGVIDCSEFLQHIKDCNLGDHEDAEIIALFKALDEDGSGTLELVEGRDIKRGLVSMQAAGGAVKEKEVRATDSFTCDSCLHLDHHFDT